jgi:hypothetical protein
MAFTSKNPDGPKRGRPVKTTVFYAVTFEHPTNAPLTVSGSICASNPARTAYLAVKDARSRANGIRWSSLVVLIDKTGPVGQKAATASGD